MINYDDFKNHIFKHKILCLIINYHAIKSEYWHAFPNLSINSNSEPKKLELEHLPYFLVPFSYAINTYLVFIVYLLLFQLIFYLITCSLFKAFCCLLRSEEAIQFRTATHQLLTPSNLLRSNQGRHRKALQWPRQQCGA